MLRPRLLLAALIRHQTLRAGVDLLLVAKAGRLPDEAKRATREGGEHQRKRHRQHVDRLLPPSRR